MQTIIERYAESQTIKKYVSAYINGKQIVNFTSLSINDSGEYFTNKGKARVKDVDDPQLDNRGLVFKARNALYFVDMNNQKLVIFTCPKYRDEATPYVAVLTKSNIVYFEETEQILYNVRTTDDEIKIAYIAPDKDTFWIKSLCGTISIKLIPITDFCGGGFKLREWDKNEEGQTLIYELYNKYYRVAFGWDYLNVENKKM
jgi:hypothetical protein